MYNETLKIKYIKEFTEQISTRERLLVLFNSVESFEEKLGKDICEMSQEELAPIISSISALRGRTSGTRISSLKDYASWCLKNNVHGATDSLFHVETDKTAAMKTQTVKNPMHLQKYLDSICDPEDEETADNTVRCFYWLAYSGMDESDILKVTAMDVSLRKMVVQYNGEEYPIYRESIHAIRNCMELTEFRYKHPNYNDGTIVYKPRADGDTIMRGIKAAPSVTSLRSELSRRSKRCLESGKTNMKLSYYRVWISGLFYRTHELELAGVPADFSVAAKKFMSGKTYKLDSGRNTIGAVYRRVISDYTVDYQRWKETLMV